MIRSFAALAFVTFSASACGAGVCEAPAVAKPRASLPDRMGWLVGDWEGTSDEGGAMDEHWVKPNGDSMLGMAREVQGGKIAFFELLRVEERGASLVLIPQPNGRAPHEFASVEIGERRAVFES